MSQLNNYYITFGSNPQYPYQNRYMVVKAVDESLARRQFMRVHPNPYPDQEDVANFSFIYNEKDWRESVSTYYNGQEPVEVLEDNSIATYLEYEETFSDKFETTIYFTGPKHLLKRYVVDNYPEADGCTVALRYLPGMNNPSTTDVEISPYKDEDGVMTDYDWTRIPLPKEDIRSLLALGMRSHGHNHDVKNPPKSATVERD